MGHRLQMLNSILTLIPIFGWVLLILAGVLLLVWVSERARAEEHRRWLAAREQKEQQDRALEIVVDETTREHIKALRARINQSRISDAYGNEDTSKAHEEIAYFITNVIFREYKAAGYDPTVYANTPEKIEAIFRRVMNLLIEYIKQAPDFGIDEVRTGVEYELFCKNILEANDWKVETTPVTGDQGADLVATYSDKRVVIQCKFYSSPVGNKAVQEAYAAKGFQQSDFAIVVSNADYTASARQLASTNDVFLLHHDQLVDLKNILENR